MTEDQLCALRAVVTAVVANGLRDFEGPRAAVIAEEIIAASWAKRSAPVNDGPHAG